MPSAPTLEFRLMPGQEATAEDRWDPLPYTPYFSVSGTVEFKHTIEPLPWFFRNTVRDGRHQIALPPGYNKLVFRGVGPGTNIVRYRIP